MTDPASLPAPAATPLPVPSVDPSAVGVRSRLVETLRRDLIGPDPTDVDIEREVLPENPARWYLTGFLAPMPDPAGSGKPRDDDPEAAIEEEGDPAFGDDEGSDPETGRARAADDTPPDDPSSRPRRLPSSLGLTFLVADDVDHVDLTLSWGDYVTEPPLPPSILAEDSEEPHPSISDLNWRRIPGTANLRLPIPAGRGQPHLLPGTGGAQRPAGALVMEAHARPYSIRQPDGSTKAVKVVTVMVVNKRAPVRRRFVDVTYAFQVRIDVRCETGIVPRYDLSAYGSADVDSAIADLHYRDVAEYAVGRGTSAGWSADPDGVVRTVFTDHLPQAGVERVEPNSTIVGVEFGMEALAQHAAAGPAQIEAALKALPEAYLAWIAAQEGLIPGIEGPHRRSTATQLMTAARRAADRIVDGINFVRDDAGARTAFRAMNEAVARAARRRNAGRTGDPVAQPAPTWRPFQLAFVLLNLRGLGTPTHPDREIADLLFFPTGGGKTEAYLGLAAWTIAYRRLTNGGLLGSGVSVLMRYTLRLLTLDQLSRAAGVICALELMRGEPAWIENGKKLLGDWPFEIGLWVGSAATPNRLGKTGDKRDDTAVAKVRRYRKGIGEAPAPIKNCPWCDTPFTPDSFACVPSDTAPRNMVIRCANTACDFTRDRPLPILTVDEAIYRRLPAFLIATVDKFAGLPWLAEAGAFFGHVHRHDTWGFYGADSPGQGQPLWNGHALLPPDLIIQDELHLISGPLGTVAALYETALDRLSTRRADGKDIRPKIVASTATVRRAGDQVRALFDRSETAIFPPPGPDRRDSFFALTVPSSVKPARLYVGLASPGRGPKLIFLRILTTILSAARAEADAGRKADAYETALAYFNALRELGGARRIVEDEVQARLATYGTQRRRVEPAGDAPFADRRMREPLELTSRVSTDKVAAAKEALARACAPDGVDVALATNMISVGLDIGRLGLMLVLGQPKTAAEYIQATSRVGRREDLPGLVIAVLNAHKPRDRLHHEGFRNFHAQFYRSVQATSVTPWAARALDRALAAVVVAIARHLSPTLTPDGAVAEIRHDRALREAVADVIVSRAPPGAVVGGPKALRDQVNNLLTAWCETAEDLTSSGGQLYYGFPRDKALLHDPLDPLLPSFSPAHQLFKAGRSMRDVEHATPLTIVDIYGTPLP
jgi:hypothetical protein